MPNRSLWLVLALSLILGLARPVPPPKARSPAATPSPLRSRTSPVICESTARIGRQRIWWPVSIRPGDTAGHYRLQWIVNESIQEGAGAVEGNKLAVTWQRPPFRPVSPNAAGCRHVHHHQQGRALRHTHGGWGRGKLGGEGVSEQETVRRPTAAGSGRPRLPPSVRCAGSRAPGKSPPGCLRLRGSSPTARWRADGS